MHRCFMDTERWTLSPLRPSKAEAHHIQHVLRARDGDKIQLFNGDGDEATAVVHIRNGMPLELERIATQHRPKNGVSLVLIQAILKGNRMEMLIEKATELGVNRIIPITTSRSIPRFDDAKARQKKARWERVAVSAAKQCGTPWLPHIEFPTTLQAATAQCANPLLLASLAAGTRPLAAEIDNLRQTRPQSVSVLIGPEGDLTTTETQQLLAAEAIPVSLGALTLRAETAAIYAISALSCMLQDTRADL